MTGHDAGALLKRGRDAALSGMMRGMNDPEIKPAPAPALPWYRALVSRTPRGRRLRRRAAVALAVLTSWYWIPELLGFSPRVFLARHGLYKMPELSQRCHHAADCTGKCAWGKPYCLRRGAGSDPNDPNGGSCRCNTKEQEEERRRPPAGCRDAVLVFDDGDAMDWSCSTFDSTDAGKRKDSGP